MTDTTLLIFHGGMDIELYIIDEEHAERVWALNNFWSGESGNTPDQEAEFDWLLQYLDGRTPLDLDYVVDLGGVEHAVVTGYLP